VDPNHNSIFTHLRDSKWFKETYQLLKKRGYQIYSNWKRSGTILLSTALACITILIIVNLLFISKISGQHNGDLKTLGGTSDWCHNFCDGNKWLMYMSFVMDILNFENFGRDFPGEWLQADLALPLTDDELQNMKDEYRRKLVEDRSRAKSVHVKKVQKNKVENMTALKFDYGEIMVNERIKVDLFKELVSGFRTPQSSPQLQITGAPLPDADKLKGYMHVEQSRDFPEEARCRARNAMMVMLVVTLKALEQIMLML
jgi:hypothetical protein